MSKAVETAKAIRAELKKEFPSVKFKVTSESYTGGTSVTIGCNNVDLFDKIETLVRKYEYGSFDSMTDMYSMNNKIEGLPQVKYVLVEKIN